MIPSRAKITTDSFNYSEFTLVHMIEKKKTPAHLGRGFEEWIVGGGSLLNH